MLIEFSFRNFKSYRERATLEMTAARTTKHSFHVFKRGGERFLPCAIIFGANASGKSNVYDAFAFMKLYVINSFIYGGGDSQQELVRPQLSPFLFNDASANEPSEFEVIFIDDADPRERTFRYGFIIDKEKVVEEWLWYKLKSQREFSPVFQRHGDEIDLLDIEDIFSNSLKSILQPETLVVSLGNKLRIPEFQAVVKWFVTNRVISFSAPIENLFRDAILPLGFDVDPTVQANLARYLATFDPSIKGFNVERTVSPENPNAFMLKVDTIHQTPNQTNKTSLPFSNESGGTQKMFSLYADIRGALEHGGVIFIDELGARLHPLLHLNIILAFLNPEINRGHAQLIVTSHDVSLLEFEHFRDDELWIAEKNAGEESTLYSFADFRDIKDIEGKNGQSLLRNYLVGKLGGVPSLNPIRFEEEE